MFALPFAAFCENAFDGAAVEFPGYKYYNTTIKCWKQICYYIKKVTYEYDNKISFVSYKTKQHTTDLIE